MEFVACNFDVVFDTVVKHTIALNDLFWIVSESNGDRRELLPSNGQQNNVGLRVNLKGNMHAGHIAVLEDQVTVTAYPGHDTARDRRDVESNLQSWVFFDGL